MQGCICKIPKPVKVEGAKYDGCDNCGSWILPSIKHESTFVGAKKKITKNKKPKSLRGSNITPPKKKRK